MSNSLVSLSLYFQKIKKVLCVYYPRQYYILRRRQKSHYPTRRRQEKKKVSLVVSSHKHMGGHVSCLTCQRDGGCCWIKKKKPASRRQWLQLRPTIRPNTLSSVHIYILLCTVQISLLVELFGFGPHQSKHTNIPCVHTHTQPQSRWDNTAYTY